MAANKFDIAKIFARLPQFLTQSEFVSIELEGAHSGGRGTIHIDGRSCASAISLWASGRCEVAFLALNEQRSTGQKNTEHYEFASETAAIGTITEALKAALEYA
jgi:hypothetical protein